MVMIFSLSLSVCVCVFRVSEFISEIFDFDFFGLIFCLFSYSNVLHTHHDDHCYQKKHKKFVFVFVFPESLVVRALMFFVVVVVVFHYKTKTTTTNRRTTTTNKKKKHSNSFPLSIPEL